MLLSIDINEKERHCLFFSDLMRVDVQCKELLERIDEQPYSVDKLTERIRRRKKRVVAPCLHSIGIAVPFANDIGYRNLGDTNGNNDCIFGSIVDGEFE